MNTPNQVGRLLLSVSIPSLSENIGLMKNISQSPLFDMVENCIVELFKFFFKDGETEEQVYKAMMNKVEEIEKKKVHEEAMRNNWYYLEPTETETKMNGPFTKHEIIGYLNHDQIDESFYCWHPSLETWEQIIDVKELDLDKRDFKIIKDAKSILEDVTPSMLKYLPRVLFKNIDDGVTPFSGRL